MPFTGATPNLASIIPDPRWRKAIYAGFAIVVLVMYAIGAYFDSIGAAHPEWLTGVLGVLTFLAAPLAGLALANAPSSDTSTVSVTAPDQIVETTVTVEEPAAPALDPATPIRGPDDDGIIA